MQLRCIASTGQNVTHTAAQHDPPQNGHIFQRAEFSADSSTLVAHTEDQHLRTFLLPADLLENDSSEHRLTACSVIRSPTRIQSYCIYPGYNQFDSSTTLLLQASADVPIALRSVFGNGHAVAKYNFIHPTTEAYLKASSLLFSTDAQHFIAGSNDSLAVFDVSQSGSGPVLKHNKKQSHSTTHSVQTSLALSGIVNSLSCNNDGILATGTFNRNVGLFANQGLGECVSGWSLKDVGTENFRTGSGIVNIQWSPDGKYLFVAERQSDIVHVFDIRNTGKRVSWLSGRHANTTQKLGIDMVPTLHGFELWAGGTDGRIRVWIDPGSKDGEHAPDDMFECHTDVVTSAIWERSGTVLATSSGSRKSDMFQKIPAQQGKIEDGGKIDEDTVSQPRADYSLKLWTI